MMTLYHAFKVHDRLMSLVPHEKIGNEAIYMHADMAYRTFLLYTDFLKRFVVMHIFSCTYSKTQVITGEVPEPPCILKEVAIVYIIYIFTFLISWRFSHVLFP